MSTVTTLYGKYKLGLLGRPATSNRVQVFTSPLANGKLRNYHVIDSSGCHVRLSLNDAAVVTRNLDALIKKWR